jgi:hypothetical protein
MSARDEDDEVLAGPVPCEWMQLDEPPSDGRIVLLCTAPSQSTNGHEGIFMGRFDGERFRFLDPRLHDGPAVAPLVAWTDFPPSPEWLVEPVGGWR